jgi:hypothetical protein
MKTLKTLQYLNSGKSLEDLYEDHKVEFSIGSNNKISLNYDSLEASNDDEIAQECRGLIVRMEGNEYKSIAVPFFRFFNFGQGSASISTKEEILASKVYEKYDGTCGIVYYDMGQWCVATRSAPDADIKNQLDLTFREIFERCLTYNNLNFNDFTSLLDKNNTYIFEILSPWNQIVVLHDHPKLVLTGCRSNITLEEMDIEQIDLPVEKAKTHSFDHWEGLILFLENRPAKEAEGFVILTPDFRRVKIKSGNYVAAHHLSSNVGSSKRNMLQAIINNLEDDLEPLIPKILFEELMALKEKYIVISHEIKDAFKDCLSSTDPNNKKEFALYVVGKYSNYKHILFGMLKHGDFDKFLDAQKDIGGYPTSLIDFFLSKMGEK